MYVNDVLKFVLNEENAICFVEQLIYLMKEVGFYLTKFVSNSRKFLVIFFEKERVNFVLNLDFDEEVEGRFQI